MSRPTSPAARSRLTFCVLASLGSMIGVATAHAHATELWVATEPGTRETAFGLQFALHVLRSSDGHSWIAGRYAQRSLWDLGNNDDPFRVETNFEPGVIARFDGRSVGTRLGFWPHAMGIELGFFHESNGLENELSRGWNRWQARIDLRVGARWTLAFTGWRGFRVESTNAQILRQRGDARLDLAWTSHDLRWRTEGTAALAAPGREDVVVPSLGARLLWRAERIQRLLPAVPGFGPPWLLLDLRTGTGEFLWDPGGDTGRVRIGIAFTTPPGAETAPWPRG